MYCCITYFKYESSLQDYNAASPPPMSVSSLEPATPSSRRAGRRVRSQSRASATSVETGITTGGAAGSVADDELPEFDDEQDLGGDDDDNAVLQEDEDEGEELFGDNMEAYELIVSLLCF